MAAHLALFLQGGGGGKFLSISAVVEKFFGYQGGGGCSWWKRWHTDDSYIYSFLIAWTIWHLLVELSLRRCSARKITPWHLGQPPPPAQLWSPSHFRRVQKVLKATRVRWYTKTYFSGLTLDPPLLCRLPPHRVRGYTSKACSWRCNLRLRVYLCVYVCGGELRYYRVEMLLAFLCPRPVFTSSLALLEKGLRGEIGGWGGAALVPEIMCSRVASSSRMLLRCLKMSQGYFGRTGGGVF